MTANHAPDAAVDDADLVRYLDGELPEPERARVEEALSRDAALSTRLEQLRDHSARFSSLLAGADVKLAAAGGSGHATRNNGGKVIELNAAWAAQQGVPARVVPPPRALPVWLRAAAIIAVLLGGSLFVPPVRAWLAGLLEPVRDGAGDSASVPDVPPVVPVDTLGIRFESSAAAWTIEFGSAPSAGVLTVEWTAADSVTAERYSDGGEEELVRMRAGLLRVRNAPASTARYRVVLPPSVTEVTIRVPGRADVTWPASVGRRSLDLGTGGS